MFAGPNGSGKSTLKAVLPPELLGVYLNPDEIERDIRTQGFLDLAAYNVNAEASSVLGFFGESSFLQAAGMAHDAARIGFEGGRLLFKDVEVNAYFASVVADFIRRRLLERKVSFTIETVMSSPDKVSLLATAQHVGYRTYLYYIATDDPEINISRVRNRVRQGGHPVPEDKIVTRYHRSLGLLIEAIRYSDRAYVFDNSSEYQARTWLAEITSGKTLELKTDKVPAWFKRAVLDKIVSSR